MYFTWWFQNRVVKRDQSGVNHKCHGPDACVLRPQMITDSHYVGEDYDVFGAWLGADAAAE